MNKAIILGNLGGEVDLKHIAGGTSVAKFSVATSEHGKDGKESVTWHNIIVWGKPADRCAEHLGKGSKVLVEGKIVNRSYEDKSGVKKYVSEIHTWSNVEFVGARKEREDVQGGRSDLDNIPF